MPLKVTPARDAKKGVDHVSKEIKSKKYAGVYYREIGGNDRSYFLRLRMDGNVKRIPIGKKSEGITEAFCNQEKARILNSHRFGEDVAKQLQKTKKEDPTFAELLTFYLENAQVKESTARGLKVLYKVPFASSRRISEDDIQAYIDDQAKRLRPATVALRSRQLKQVIRYALKKKKYQYDDPTRVIDLPKGTGGRKRFLSPDEINRLLDAVRKKPHVYLFVKMALCTGARIGTLISVHSDDIHPDGSVTLMNHKSGRVYTGYLDEETMSLVEGKKGYVLARKGQEHQPPKLPRVQRPLLDAMDKLFNTPETPVDERVVVHTLRHTVASQMVRKGVPMEVISRTLDHSSVAITAQVYAHVPGDLVKKAVTDLWK